MNSLEGSPRPNQMMARGIHASGGIRAQQFDERAQHIADAPVPAGGKPHRPCPRALPVRKPAVTRKRLHAILSRKALAGSLCAAVRTAVIGPGKMVGSMAPSRVGEFPGDEHDCDAEQSPKRVAQAGTAAHPRAPSDVAPHGSSTRSSPASPVEMAKPSTPMTSMPMTVISVR